MREMSRGHGYPGLFDSFPMVLELRRDVIRKCVTVIIYSEVYNNGSSFAVSSDAKLGYGLLFLSECSYRLVKNLLLDGEEPAKMTGKKQRISGDLSHDIGEKVVKALKGNKTRQKRSGAKSGHSKRRR